MNLDELNEKEDDIDEEDERMFEEYRLLHPNSLLLPQYNLHFTSSCET